MFIFMYLIKDKQNNKLEQDTVLCIFTLLSST